jgi:hypothetical protein
MVFLYVYRQFAAGQSFLFVKQHRVALAAPGAAFHPAVRYGVGLDERLP